MKICGSVLVILYAGLMIFAIYKERAKSVSSAFIAIGCLSALAYSLLSLVWRRNDILILSIGMISISIGTLINGLKQKKIHIHHHVIRLVIEALILAVCWIGG